MKRTEWFQRKFPLIEDNGLMPVILERLSGTAARLRSKLSNKNIDFSKAEAGKWSIKMEVGHLSDLEPLWAQRALNFINGDEHLTVTDLTNRRTFEAGHDTRDLDSLIQDFEHQRQNLLQILNEATEQDLERHAIHPRLKTPMRLVDHAFFVAEHDDHHLAQITLLIKQQQ